VCAACTASRVDSVRRVGGALRHRLTRRRVGRAGPSNKGMKLTKLSAAPTLAPQAPLGRSCRRMPAQANGMDAGTASQLIPGVRPLRG
jgi:hypothetical protein